MVLADGGSEQALLTVQALTSAPRAQDLLEGMAPYPRINTLVASVSGQPPLVSTSVSVEV